MKTLFWTTFLTFNLFQIIGISIFANIGYPDILLFTLICTIIANTAIILFYIKTQNNEKNNELKKEIEELKRTIKQDQQH